MLRPAGPAGRDAASPCRLDDRGDVWPIYSWMMGGAADDIGADACADLAGFKKLLVFGLEIDRAQEAADLCSRFGVILR